VRIVQTITDLRAALSGLREICLVPTMGNLHDGHLSLVRIAASAARKRGGVVVASIFVNPLQFAPHEDFAEYPRTLERDCELLAGGGCDIVFAPSAQEMYPEAQEYTVRPPAALADILEGSSRPAFFTGVCTVVLKLFSIVQPNVAVFGKKDYQQLLIVSKMVRQLALPMEIVPADTVRDADGLALSSRNSYLDERDRIEAAQLHATLRILADQVRTGRSDWARLESSAFETLRARGWRPDYVAIRGQADLELPLRGQPLIALAAAKLGDIRLIDNLDI
jgi:pantoate--beta-alanine ligase